MLWGLFVTTAEPGGPDGFRWKSLVAAVQRVWGCGGDIKLCPSPLGKYSPPFFFSFSRLPQGISVEQEELHPLSRRSCAEWEQTQVSVVS